MTPGYPSSFATIGAWAQENTVSANEARVRFAQYAILQSIAAVRQLREGLVFKGGNALDFIWQPNRSTVDLDFSVDHESALATQDAETLQTLLERGNGVSTAATGVLLVAHQVRQNPPGEDRHFVTFQVRVGYSLPDQARLRQRMQQGERSPQIIDLDISINEPIGDARIRELGPGVLLRVATIEDIVTEKLRALLQQPIRNRQRRQDLLDIAVILRENATFDRGLVAAFLLTKAEARGVPVSRSAFRNPEIAERASVGYAALQETTRIRFVPFDEALELLQEFVNDLEIPD